jgi:glycosyltransferase involved in cell wall biosynthesis
MDPQQKPVHVAVLYRFGFMGGAERNGFTTMGTLRERNIRFTVVCPDGGRLADEARSRGFDVQDCRWGPERTVMSLRWFGEVAVSMARTNIQLRRFCRQNEVDILHAHGPISATACIDAVRTLHIPLLVHVHDAQPPKTTYRAALRLLMPYADTFVCVSKASQAAVLSVGVPEKKTQIVYNGLSERLLNSTFTPEPSVNGPGPHIAVVGHLYELKGQRVFLEAARRLAKDFPTAKFYLIGEVTFDDSQSYADDLRSIAETPELKGRVVFTGYQPNAPEWMAAMDVIASTSILPEALPTVCLEAMSLGKLVVGTNIGGTLEIIRHGENGFLVPPNNPTALADTISTMLRLPSDNDIGRKAAQEIRERFTPQAFSNAIEGVYRNLLERRPAAIPARQNCVDTETGDCRPLHVVVIYRFDFLGGAERVGLTAIRQLRNKGYRFTLICPDGGRLAEEARRQDIEVVGCPWGALRNAGSVLGLAETMFSMMRINRWMRLYCRRNQIDLIHAHGPITAAGCITAASWARVPLVVHIHDAQEPKRTYRTAVRALRQVASRFLCVSEAARDAIVSMGVPARKVEVLYNGLSHNLLNGNFEPEPSVRGPGPHIGMVGHLYPLKGQVVFLKAAGMLLKNYPDAMFYIIGERIFEDSEQYVRSLHALADTPELKGHVVFTGYQSNVPEWMMAMDAIAMTSVLPEALPTVCLEAMALGKRLVGTNIGGTAEIIKHGETGLLTPPGNPQALADALRTLIELPPDHPIGQKASVDIRRRFHPEAFAESIDSVYHELTSVSPVKA